MNFFKRCEKKEDNNCKKLTQDKLEIVFLRDKIYQLQDDHQNLLNVHNDLVRQFDVIKYSVTDLCTKKSEVRDFIEQFREMILVGYRLLGYNQSWFPLSEPVEHPFEGVPQLPKKKKKKS